MSIAPCGFSEYLEVGSELQARRCVALFKMYKREIEAAGGVCDWHVAPSGAAIWIYDGETCDTRQVVEFVHRVAERHGVRGKWGMSWVDLSHGIRPGQIYGGTVRLDLGQRGSEQWIDSREFLRRTADGDWLAPWTGLGDQTPPET
jgi:hypothetical protein